ncbi:hypothetical protein AVEN_61109-1, partial [Araneus ventricosus]
EPAGTPFFRTFLGNGERLSTLFFTYTKYDEPAGRPFFRTFLGNGERLSRSSLLIPKYGEPAGRPFFRTLPRNGASSALLYIPSTTSLPDALFFAPSSEMESVYARSSLLIPSTMSLPGRSLSPRKVQQRESWDARGSECLVDIFMSKYVCNWLRIRGTKYVGVSRTQPLPDFFCTFK